MKRLLIALIALCSIQAVTANHETYLDAVELHYVHVGNGSYDVYLTFHRRCHNANASLVVLNANCSSNSLLDTATLISVSDVTASSLGCSPTTKDTTCGAETLNDRVEALVYKASFDFSSYTNCCEWVISYTDIGLRDANTGSFGQATYLAADLNRCFGDHSSSLFNSPASLSAVHNRNTFIDLSVKDTGNHFDSISYHLISGYQSAATSVTYSGQYSPTRPLTFFGYPNQNLSFPAGFHLSSLGMLSFRPTGINQKALVVVEARSYQDVNGSMTTVSTIRREFEILMLRSLNDYDPELRESGQNTLTNKHLIYYLDTLNLFLLASDQDSAQSGNVTSISKPAYVTHSISRSSAGDSIYFQIAPGIADVNQLTPDSISVQLWDSVCPDDRRSLEHIELYIYDKPEVLIRTDSICKSWVVMKDSTSKLINYAGYPFVSEWEVRDASSGNLIVSNLTADSLVLGIGPYWVKVNYGYSGERLFSDSIYLPATNPGIHYSLNTSDTICHFETAYFNLSITGDTTSYFWGWSRLQSGNQVFMPSDSQLVIDNFGVKQNSSYLFSIQEKNGCFTATDTLNLIVESIIPVNLPDSLLACEGSGVALKLIPKPTDHDILWSTGSQDDSIYVNQTGLYTVHIQDKGKYCPATGDTTYVQVVDKPKVEQISDTTGCTGLTLDAVSTDNRPYNYLWNWSWTGPSFTPSTSGAVYLRAGYNGCYHYDTIQVMLMQGPLFAVIPSVREVCGDDSLLVQVSSNIGSSYQIDWSSGSDSTKAYLPAGIYTVSVQDSAGCITTKQADITGLAEPNPSFGTLINGSSVQFFPAVTQGYHFWDFGDGSSVNGVTQPTHSFTAVGNYAVRHRVEATNGCISDTTQTISVFTNISELESGGLMIWPNPVKSELWIDAGIQDESVRVNLYGIDGRSYGSLYSGSMNGETRLNLPSGLCPGTYLVLMKTATRILRGRVMIR